MVSSHQFISFQEKIGILKHLRRTGWVVRGVPMAETVADHSWRMALMALQTEKELLKMGVDTNKVIEMCLLHDVGESVIGDIIPEIHQTSKQKVTKEEKKKYEMEAVLKLAHQFSFPKLSTLFAELEAGETRESQIVQNLDKLDMLLQAYEYKCQYPYISRLDEFMQYNKDSVTIPFFSAVVDEIESRQAGNPPQESCFIDFQQLCGRLKHLERSGPKMYEIKNCETVAGHCFRTAIMALQLEDEIKMCGVNVCDIVRLALVHDLGEAIIGDIVPEKWQQGTKITATEKNKMEADALLNVSKKYQMPFVLQAYQKMEKRKNLAAVITKDIEIYESIQQAYEYIKVYPEKAILREYIPYHKPRIKTPFVLNIINSITQKQNNFLIARRYSTFYSKDDRN